jgi:hypothetical protein
MLDGINENNMGKITLKKDIKKAIMLDVNLKY